MEPELESALRNLLEDERRRAGGADEARKSELRYHIAKRESELASDDLLQVFNDHITELPEESRPKSELEKYRLFPEWEKGLKQEFAAWKDELDKLESKSLDGRLIYNNARERVLQALESVAQEAGLLPRTTPRWEIPARRFNGPRQLSNGLYMDCSKSKKGIARLCRQLLTQFGQDPAQFHVQLR